MVRFHLFIKITTRRWLRLRLPLRGQQHGHFISLGGYGGALFVWRRAPSIQQKITNNPHEPQPISSIPAQEYQSPVSSELKALFSERPGPLQNCEPLPASDFVTVSGRPMLIPPRQSPPPGCRGGHSGYSAQAVAAPLPFRECPRSACSHANELPCDSELNRLLVNPPCAAPPLARFSASASGSAITDVHQVKKHQNECCTKANKWDDTGRRQQPGMAQTRAACRGEECDRDECFHFGGLGGCAVSCQGPLGARVIAPPS
jgi:hypothetical protein